MLESSEEECYYFFYSADLQKSAGQPVQLTFSPENKSVAEKILKNPRVIYLVDMGDTKPTFRVRTSGYSIFSSSLVPYNDYIKKLAHKLDLQKYAPPLWTKPELKVVYEYTGVKNLRIFDWRASHQGDQ